MIGARQAGIGPFLLGPKKSALTARAFRRQSLSGSEIEHALRSCNLTLGLDGIAGLYGCLNFTLFSPEKYEGHAVVHRVGEKHAGGLREYLAQYHAGNDGISGK